MRDRAEKHPLPLRLMVLCVAMVLSVGACRDGDDQSVETPPETSDAPTESGPLAGREDLAAYGIAYRVPEGWESISPPPSGMSLGWEDDEVAHVLTRADGTHVAAVSVTTVDAETSDGRAVSTAELAVNLRLLLGLAATDARDDAQEQYSVPGTEEATRVDLVFDSQDATLLLVDTGTGAAAVLSVLIDRSARPTLDEVPEGITDAVLASVSVE
ncbi:hypothetical protein [Nocardiopsis alba]|uniref:hypothetical protein n=1 Tax=Nocardiopsis alba TaxID=53437 RepID=UPI001F28F7A4|nr:hypothetical protein [Nocardiopsis alba]